MCLSLLFNISKAFSDPADRIDFPIMCFHNNTLLFLSFIKITIILQLIIYLK